MSTVQRAALAHLDTQAFALMGRLHVILRRESGRVTDIEYMRIDPAYCKHVLELANQIQHEALPEICVRLREIFFGPDGLFLSQTAKPVLSPRTLPLPDAPESSASPAAASEESSTATIEQTYVGRLR